MGSNDGSTKAITLGVSLTESKFSMRASPKLYVHLTHSRTRAYVRDQLEIGDILSNCFSAETSLLRKLERAIAYPAVRYMKHIDLARDINDGSCEPSTQGDRFMPIHAYGSFRYRSGRSGLNTRDRWVGFRWQLESIMQEYSVPDDAAQHDLRVLYGTARGWEETVDALTVCLFDTLSSAQFRYTSELVF